ncbi:MAG: hypothetical protein KME54_11965 [Tolypothrix brevis GSE-NOS-MK-07-07A]|jgi:hypothetical protein|nr:hypothetical protein [Tolypothrix brevis GSE-NOS-MK-07-07A]
MNFYKRKLYALLQSPESRDWGDRVASSLACLQTDLNNLKHWWEQGNSDTQPGKQAQDIGSSSDRINLDKLITTRENPEKVTVCHAISGQKLL